jgi:hypothetical protein
MVFYWFIRLDHVLPESLLSNLDELARVLTDYGLPAGFDINGFENWLPAHARCNQKRGSTVIAFVPKMKMILDRLISLSPEVARTAMSIQTTLGMLT